MTTKRCERLWGAWLLALALLTLGASPSLAGEPKAPVKSFAVIHGTVWSAEGHPIYGVEVEMRRVGDKKHEWRRVSDHRGEFAMRVAPEAADYEIVAVIKTPKGAERPKTVVHVDGEMVYEAGLHLLQ